MTQQELLISLPPSPVIRRFSDMLQPDVSRTVLDAGCGTGRNSLHLAKQGHDVCGVSAAHEELLAARELLGRLGSIAGRCSFVNADVRHLPFRQPFDIALSNEVLHLMSKTDSRHALAELRSLTKQGGLNVVSGYVVRPETANVRNTAACFAPNELRDAYLEADWQVLDYDEQYRPNQYVGTAKREIISSVATVIAQRRWTEQG